MKFVKWFEEIGAKDVALVGGKNASLGEMVRNLSEKGVDVPSGFAITAEAYKYMVEKLGISQKIRDTLAGLDTHDMNNLAERGEKIRNLIENSPCPKELEDEIRICYRKMECCCEKQCYCRRFTYSLICGTANDLFECAWRR
jgi:pyruvate,water dikinase